MDLNQQRNPSNNPLIHEAEAYASLQNAVHYCTSAKLGKGIDELFLELTKRMIEHREKVEAEN